MARRRPSPSNWSPRPQTTRPTGTPAWTDLGRLAPSGRRSQAAGLGRIARFLSGGRLLADELPWHLVRYQHVQRVRPGWQTKRA
jgi:hypothetical protein